MPRSCAATARSRTTGSRSRARYLLSRLTSPGFSATSLVYLLRAIHAGGEAAQVFLEHLIDEVRAGHGAVRRRPASCVPRATRRPACATSPTSPWAPCSCSSSRHRTPRRRSSSLRCATAATRRSCRCSSCSPRDSSPIAALLEAYLSYLWEPPDGGQRLHRTPGRDRHLRPPLLTEGLTMLTTERNPRPATWPSRCAA